MKRLVLTIGLCLALTPVSAAVAQEQQVYSPDGVTRVDNPAMNQVIVDSYAIRAQQAQMQAYQANRERERPYMQRFPDHPGDYRDAVDRGAWATGNARDYPTHSFDIQ